MMVSFLPDAETRPYWNDLYLMLKPAADYGRCEVLEPDDLVWVAIDAWQIIGAVTTRLISPEEAEIKHVAGTRMHEWIEEIEDMICESAKDSGAVKIVSRGRKGWGRLMRNRGWIVAGHEDGLTLYEKVL